MISAFVPRVIGENVEGKVLIAEVAEQCGRKSYQFELGSPRIFITTTIVGNCLYLFVTTCCMNLILLLVLDARTCH